MVDIRTYFKSEILAESKSFGWKEKLPQEVLPIEPEYAPKIMVSWEFTDLKPIDIFSLFFSDEILDIIVSHTNESYENRVEKHSRDKYWASITREDIINYIGLLIMMGIDRKPQYDMHWQTHGLWESKLIKSTMSLNKFISIGTYLKIGSPNAIDKLARVRRVSDHIQEVSTRIYVPRKEMTIDESMVAYKGRHGLKQYLPMKPTKWGFKAFLLCESQSGYCYKHKFFTGPGQEEFKNINLCLDLCTGMEKQNYHIYCDNFYTSYELCSFLLNKGVECTGTVRLTSRKLPPNIKEKAKRIASGEAVFYQNNQISLTLYGDKRIVKIISNKYSNETIRVSKRQIPYALHCYRKYMGGVDKFDQRLSYYSYPHKFVKWWKSIFIYLLELAIHNSFIVYSEILSLKYNKNISYLDFRIELVKALTNYSTILGISDQEEENKLSAAIPEQQHKRIKTDIAKKCNFCKNLGKRSNCTTVCSLCNQYFHDKCFSQHY